MRWEYSTLDFDEDRGIEDFNELLTTLGEGHWELVQVWASKTGSSWMVLKRAKPD